jgi:hypothetical protein
LLQHEKNTITETQILEEESTTIESLNEIINVTNELENTTNELIINEAENVGSGNSTHQIFEDSTSTEILDDLFVGDTESKSAIKKVSKNQDQSRKLILYHSCATNNFDFEFMLLTYPLHRIYQTKHCYNMRRTLLQRHKFWKRRAQLLNH